MKTHISWTKVGTNVIFHEEVLFQIYDFQLIIIIIIQKICSAHISTLLGAQGANPETPGQAPFLFHDHVLGSFTCTTQHTRPTALRPIRRMKRLWLSVLLKDTSAATGQAGIRTHILTTPELESSALDRSATTLHTDLMWPLLLVQTGTSISTHSNTKCIGILKMKLILSW